MVIWNVSPQLNEPVVRPGSILHVHACAQIHPHASSPYLHPHTSIYTHMSTVAHGWIYSNTHSHSYIHTFTSLTETDTLKHTHTQRISSKADQKINTLGKALHYIFMDSYKKRNSYSE